MRAFNLIRCKSFLDLRKLTIIIYGWDLPNNNLTKIAL